MAVEEAIAVAKMVLVAVLDGTGVCVLGGGVWCGVPLLDGVVSDGSVVTRGCGSKSAMLFSSV